MQLFQRFRTSVRVMTSVITLSFRAETKDELNQSFLSMELCSVAEGNFAQSFMGKKSKLLIENLFSICDAGMRMGAAHPPNLG